MLYFYVLYILFICCYFKVIKLKEYYVLVVIDIVCLDGYDFMMILIFEYKNKGRFFIWDNKSKCNDINYLFLRYSYCFWC